MKKLILLTLLLFQISAVYAVQVCGTETSSPISYGQNKYILHFDDLDFWPFSGCIAVDDFDKIIQIMKSFDLKNCVVRVVTEDKFSPEEFKYMVKMSAYNMDSMSDNPGKLEDFNNKGDLVIPDGSGLLEIYNSDLKKVIEINYSKGLPTSIKLYHNNTLFYYAYGEFEVSYFEGHVSYNIVSVRYTLKYIPY